MTLYAQKPTHKIGGGGFTFGYGNQNLNAFKPMMDSKVGNIENKQLMLGITGNRIYKRWMTGLSIGAMLGDKIETDTLLYKFSALNLSVDGGYLITQKEHFMFFSTIGLGVNNFSLKQKRTKQENLNPRVSNKDRAINIYNTGFYVDLALNIRFLGKRQTDNGYSSSMMTGIKIGYMLGLNSSTWRYTGGSITNGAPFAAKMPYIQLILGGFGSKPIKHIQSPL